MLKLNLKLKEPLQSNYLKYFFLKNKINIILNETYSSSKQFLHYFQSSSLVTNLSEVTVSNDQINLNCPPSEPKTSSGEPKSQDQQENNLELDELNRHPCMPTILKLIDVIQEKFGAQNDPKAMPSWMLSLHSKFLEIGNYLKFFTFFSQLVFSIFRYKT